MASPIGIWRGDQGVVGVVGDALQAQTPTQSRTAAASRDIADLRWMRNDTHGQIAEFDRV